MCGLIPVSIIQCSKFTIIAYYPPRLEYDVSHLTVGNPLRIGDIEKLLPEGTIFAYIHS